jgi:glycerol-3-phosphate O-acyltransferase
VEDKNGIIIPNYAKDKAAHSIIMLSYYRNHLVHVFINDAEISTTLFRLKQTDISTLYKKSRELKELLNEEFVVRDTIRTE